MTSSSPPPPPPRRRRSDAYLALLVLGWLLLVVWTIWWAENFSAGMLLPGLWTWVPNRAELGSDLLHNYLGVRDWLAGNNPYTHLFGDPTGIPYNYAPIVLVLFLWCGWIPFAPAAIVWACVVALIIAAATRYTVKLRPKLGLQPLPLPFALGVMLLGTPVLFAMERGNCDALPLLAILAATITLKKRSRTGDTIAGICLALATLIKVYPALAILGLIPLRRIRPLLIACVAGLLISAITPSATLEWLHNMHADALHHHVALTTFSHTISGYWQYLFDNHSLRPLLHIPSVIGAGLILLPLFAITALAIHRSQRRDLLTFPYLCWLTQAACFWSPVSYDYKLFFFQFTILCLWQRRSPWYVHALLAPFLLYWQPMRIPALGPILLLIIKFAALVGSAILLQIAANRSTDEQDQN